VNAAERDLTPREILAELDRYVVGQQAAKKAVAIALRNRWRRRQVEGPLRDEITPKNILMIGPTGVGKTEIARRLARLARAPFVKVEASRDTEVGYVGPRGPGNWPRNGSGTSWSPSGRSSGARPGRPWPRDSMPGNWGRFLFGTTSRTSPSP